MQVITVNSQYASGNRRILAWSIDSIIVGMLIALVLFWSGHGSDFFYSIGQVLDAGFHYYSLVEFAIAVLYFSYMESSKYQATLGKIALGIRVVDQNNMRLTFKQALLRNLSKVISAFIFCLGYIMIIFDERKQGLHDKIAETFVVRE
ncbi:MAG: domain containing protein [Bacteroidota bacterium]|nr:domain containing protein [Bacteroidota bacterium]